MEQMAEKSTHNAVKPLIAGNWKMNGLSKDLSQIRALALSLRNQPAHKCEVLICPPVTLLAVTTKICLSGAVFSGAQDCHIAQNGAHTGDIGAKMLADAGAQYIIVGHSERRSNHHETDGLVNAKARAVLEAGITPIICVGETQAERLSALALTVVEKQLNGSVPELEAFQNRVISKNLVIAYEPVWAIGTGLVPEQKDITTVHSAIRDWLVGRFGEDGNSVRVLYGGSMKPENAATILDDPNVNGGLIGGASLKAEDFLAIIRAA